MAWAVTFYQSRTGKVPARDFLANCAPNVRRKLLVVLEVVRAAPPPSFSGGGMWEAMHGTMNGYYEIRTTGPGRRHYRLYCILDNGSKAELAERGFRQSHIVVVNGLVKPNARCSPTVTTGDMFASSASTTTRRCLGRWPTDPAGHVLLLRPRRRHRLVPRRRV